MGKSMPLPNRYLKTESHAYEEQERGVWLKSSRSGLGQEGPLSNRGALDDHRNSPWCLCLSVLLAERSTRALLTSTGFTILWTIRPEAQTSLRDDELVWVTFFLSGISPHNLLRSRKKCELVHFKDNQIQSPRHSIGLRMPNGRLNYGAQSQVRSRN